MKNTRELYASRPTSPHLEIYKPQISSVLSILHRITGVGLFIALSTLSWWMNFWIYSKFDKDYLETFCNCWIIRTALYATSFAFFYHMCTGIRHLIWDTGSCFSIKNINLTGWIAVVCALIFTVIFWVCIL
jgi:succinate dehydrogenase / fumarate reductase cytochrome b subunit